VSFLKRWLGGSSPEPTSEAPAAEASIDLAEVSIDLAEASIDLAEASIDLDALVEALSFQLYTVTAEAADPDVVRARIADVYRDIEVAPMDPLEFEAYAAGLDEAAWRRMALLAGAAEGDEALGEALAARAAGEGAADQVKRGFIDLARDTPLLTMDLLAASSLRVEELARRFIAAVGAAVEDETPEASQAALVRLDYGRLLAEAERAKMSAEQRMEYLRKLQEEHEAARPRRGKW